MNLNKEHLIQVAKEKHISKWTVSDCAVCDYPIHFLIRSSSEILYDGGCNCSDMETKRDKYVPSSWEDIITTILKLHDEELLKATKFWNL